MTIFFLFFFALSYFSLPARTENSTNICDRCKCDNLQDIFTMDCSDQKFFHMLANWPPHTSTIIKASFPGNNFTSLEALPETKDSLEIILSRCNIRSMQPGVFEATTKITFIDLSHNFLKADSISRENFRGPNVNKTSTSLALEKLDLSYNEIHTLYNGAFDFLPNLTRLNLAGNDLTVLDSHTQLVLSSISGLQSLNLANNDLTDLVPNAIENLPNLVSLDLSKNVLDFVPHSLEKVGRSLNVLIMDDNPIIELTAKTFSSLNKLTELSLNNLTKLKQIDPHVFASLPNLTKLHICNNTNLEKIDVEAFSSNVTTLKELYLNDNKLTTIPYLLLSKWDQLDILEFRDNPLVCDCDLYKISNNVSDNVRRNKDGPTCLNSWYGKRLQVYELTNDMCSMKGKRKKLSYHHMSISLVGLLVTLSIGLLVAITLGYSRYRRFMRNKSSDAYASQVIYSPLLNSRL